VTRRTRGGIALPAALAAVAVAAALAGAIAEIARVETVIARHRRTAAAALAAGDTCLTRLLAALPCGLDFAELLAGPDGVRGSADDGTVGALPGCTATAAAAAGAGEHVVVTVDARAGSGRRVLAAVVGRAPTPGPASLLWLPLLPGPGAVRGVLTLDGVDARDPTAPAVAGLAAGTDPDALDAWLSAVGAGTTARTPPPLYAAAPPLDPLVQRVRVTGHAGAETLVVGAPAGPTLAFVDGDVVVPSALRGAGLLVVNGLLDVQGALDFTGVIVATRGVHVASAGRLVVEGALWSGGVTDPLHVEGELALRQGRAAVAAADGLLRLPRQPLLLGLRDLG